MMNKQQFTAARLRQAREELDLSQEELGRRYGASGAHISQIERGKRGIGLKSLQRLAEVLGKPVAWFIADSAAAPTRSIHAIISEFERATERLEVIEIPLLGTISAGQPLMLGESKEEYVTVPKEMLGPAGNNKNIYALRISDDHMISDGILSGDTVIINPEKEILDGKIYALRLGDEVLVRHVYQNKKTLRLEATGDIHRQAARSETEILGRVILSFRRH